MTRSNNSYNIGFMAAPERVNVLLSRARDGLIMIGNSDTFLNARKGKEVWRKLFDLLKENNHVYEGFPVKCEKHPNRTGLLSSPEDFETECPDGGCKEPWYVDHRKKIDKNNLTFSSGVLLKCDLHKCPSSCHQLFDHSKVPCKFIITRKCSNGHNQQWQCHAGAPPVCAKCENDRKQAEKKVQRDLAAKIKREAKVQTHLNELAKLDEQIAQFTRRMEDSRLDNEQQAVLAQKRKDLEATKERANKTQNPLPGDPLGIYHDDCPKPRKQPVKEIPNTSTKPSKSAPNQQSNLREHIKTAVEHNKSRSKADWQRQKDQENASNPAIDDIMEMIGLEDVKSQVLRIKAKVDTSVRQNTDLKKERLGLVLLGNPGTGTLLVRSRE